MDKIEEIAAMGRYREFDDLFAEAGSRYSVDPNLLKAIAWHESRFDPQKVHEGGHGLMQIGEGTGIEWAAMQGIETFMATDLLDARTNIHAGAWYVASALNRWRNTDDPTVFVLAEYVAGPETIRNWAGSKLSVESLRQGMAGTSTSEFVDRVLEWKRGLR